MNKYQQSLNQIIKEAVVHLNTIDEDNFAKRPFADKWSKKEILGHLIDSAYNNHQRFVRAKNRPNLIFEGYDQVAWVKRNAYQDRSASDIIICWQVVNNHLANMIGHLSEEVLNRKLSTHNFHQIGMRPIEATDAVSIAYMIEDYLFHTEHHLAQIIENYRWLSER